MAVDTVMSVRNGWRQVDTERGTFWHCGFEQSRSVEQLASELLSLIDRPQDVAEWLKGLDGFFALVARNDRAAVAAVDRVRSIPLLWSANAEALVVSNDKKSILERISGAKAVFDESMVHVFAQSGFTIGDGTLVQDIRQLCPGQWLHSHWQPGTVKNYHTWRPFRPTSENDADLERPLADLHEKIISKLIGRAKGCTILVPLSAGLDSRFVVSGLAAAGYENVVCFAYGKSGNREAAIGRQIAKRLGYPWHFIDYTTEFVRAGHYSDAHRSYLETTDSLTSIHFPQDFPAIVRLKDDGIVTDDCVVVNGQSGDFITGNHIPESFTAKIEDREARWDRLLDALIAKHFRLWDALATPNREAGIKKILRNRLESLGGLPDDAERDHGLYELSEFEDRQSKYVLNGQRTYEFLGLDWHLPLWDRDYLDFWESAPKSAKIGQSLYKHVLRKTNWAGVWTLPVNPTRIRPRWIIPLRFMAKVAHAPLGQARWHRFEKRYFEYLMSALNAYAPWPYAKIAQDKRGARNALAFHVEDYLARKGFNWTGDVGLDHAR